LHTLTLLYCQLIISREGSDLRTSDESLTKLLCDQIFILPIHWTKATALPEDATHAIDFGPGGLSGIGGLTARNWEGRGIRTIIIGDKGKGDLELYRASHVQFDDWWRKKFAPKLVRTA
jgi:fatty acid synthase subunit alpha, fungi type